MPAAGATDASLTASSLPSNRIELSARLLEREALRYTPGGTPMCHAVVEHDSEQAEGGERRTVRLVIAARFSGEQASRIAAEPLGAMLLLQGFLSPKRLHRDGKPSGALQIHVLQYRKS